MANIKKNSKGIRKLTNRQLFWVGLSVLSIVAGALGTSTYAWFIASDALTIKNMHIKLKNSKGLSIGFKKDGAISYFDNLNEETIINNSDNAKIEHKLKPVSGMHEYLWLNEQTNMHTAFPSFREQFQAGSNEFKYSKLAEDGYIQFEAFIKSEEPVIVTLDKDNFKVQGSHDENFAYAESRYGKERAEEECRKLDAIADCVRVSFLTDDQYLILEPNVDKSSKTELGGLLDLNPFNDFYDEYDGKEILYGEYNSDEYLVYGDVLSESIPNNGKKDGFSAGHAKGVRPLDLEKSKEKGLIIKEEKTYTIDELAIGENDYYLNERIKPLFQLEGNESKRVVISMYIEGWDKDCTNKIADALFDVTFAFTALELPSYKVVNENTK